jgi:formylglycine-generating enzyme required for sulfatase activity
MSKSKMWNLSFNIFAVISLCACETNSSNKPQSVLLAESLVMVAIPGKSYEMEKYEVTQKEWRAVMGSNPSHFSNCGDTCPVENVSWNDIQIYLQKLNSKTGKQYRLPTEAEWEYACAGGTITLYCGSNDINAVAWYKGNINSTTHPVGQKQANGFGLYDMSGNVWEWMENKYDNERDSRALRGGSWFFIPQYVRKESRSSCEPAYRADYIGFRVARTLP